MNLNVNQQTLIKLKKGNSDLKRGVQIFVNSIWFGVRHHDDFEGSNSVDQYV